MPDYVCYGYATRRKGRGWKYMERWQRKAFHRENESRARNGLKPLPKPKNVPERHGI